MKPRNVSHIPNPRYPEFTPPLRETEIPSPREVKIDLGETLVRPRKPEIFKDLEQIKNELFILAQAVFNEFSLGELTADNEYNKLGNLLNRLVTFTAKYKPTKKSDYSKALEQIKEESGEDWKLEIKRKEVQLYVPLRPNKLKILPQIEIK